MAASTSFKVNGFTALPISYSKSSTHYLYARAHASSNKKDPKQQNQLPNGRTLFLVNVPPDATERELVMFFKQAGTVEKVIFDFDVKELRKDEEGTDSEADEDEMDLDGTADAESSEHPRKRQKIVKDEPPKVVELPSRPHRTIRKTGLTAYVVFLDESSLSRALSPSSKPRPWPTSSEEPSGLSHYITIYENLRPPLDLIQEHVDTYMELFEYKQAKEKQKSKYLKGEAIVDEDGFTLVTRGGAYGKTLGGGVAVATKQFQRSGATSRTRPKKKKEKEGFYAFQKAEKQRTELMNLKKKWEEDKAKVEKLKASRRFKPY
ncbi:hypothetical protein CC1G_08839 [Coprinopsis cinerea okayama7|uniref:RRM domain-containing protein n=1 Tax=Coprinopsis cinerea (strain Okayama-7 / 130 / ATCC MYA-4618 / FGSC 9003) TaxID=240176 RepID=A8P6A2_COPC7|nr:hypothetical protein CC1G_08839 [Coprinopsis cinerea okayama7\|eukprot:XP_001839113.1 hypothetical protein CC1G_08839 [Coprinopsis cinerea okayama7\